LIAAAGTSAPNRSRTPTSSAQSPAHFFHPSWSLSATSAMVCEQQSVSVAEQSCAVAPSCGNTSGRASSQSIARSGWQSGAVAPAATATNPSQSASSAGTIARSRTRLAIGSVGSAGQNAQPVAVTP
jgi:hypothetical protein